MAELENYFPDGVEYVIGHDGTLFIEAWLETVFTLFFTIMLAVVFYLPVFGQCQGNAGLGRRGADLF